jgi:uncharacterized protein YutE (UPF0331/DUF86 family)
MIYAEIYRGTVYNAMRENLTDFQEFIYEILRS